jgi:hypothetical protein
VTRETFWDQDQTENAISSSADGNVHVFESDDSERKVLDPGLYANMVRVGKLSEKDKKATIFVAGSALVADEKSNC